MAAEAYRLSSNNLSAESPDNWRLKLEHKTRNQKKDTRGDTGPMKPIGLLLFVSLALAQPAKKDDAREVKATGCVRKAVEGGCLLLRTMDGATTYNIFATPPPPVDTAITMEGKPHHGPTSCMEGI